MVEPSKQSFVDVTAWAGGQIHTIDIDDRIIAGRSLGVGKRIMRLRLDEESLIKAVRDLGYVVRQSKRKVKRV